MTTPPARRPVWRRAAAALVAVLALGTAVLATEARSLEADLARRMVEVGAPVEGRPAPGSADPFSPFAFAVVGPVRGDHAALERALDLLAERDVRFVVLHGDLLDDDGEGALAIAAVLRDRPWPVVALPEEADLTGRGLDDVQRHVGLPDWWFVERECLFVGGEPTTKLPEARHVVRFARGADAADGALLAPKGEPGELVAHVHRLGEEPDGAVLAVGLEQLAVVRGASLASVVRGVELSVLAPLVASTAGYVVALLVCGLALFGGLWFAQSARPTA